MDNKCPIDYDRFQIGSKNWFSMYFQSISSTRTPQDIQINTLFQLNNRSQTSFLPAVLPQDARRSRWIREGRIDSRGVVAGSVEAGSSPLPAKKREEIANWVWMKQVPVESSIPQLFWQTVLPLYKTLALFLESFSLLFGEVAITGQVAQELLLDYSQELLQERGFLTREEAMGKHRSSGEVTVRCRILGVAEKKAIKGSINGLLEHLAPFMPPALLQPHTIAYLRLKFPGKYISEEIFEALIGNTAFRKLFYKEDPDQRFFRVALGDGKTSTLEVVLANKLRAGSFFRFEDIGVDIRSLFGPNPSHANLSLVSELGALQALVDYDLKRVRLTCPAESDPLIFFRWHALKGEGFLMDDPEETEGLLFEKVKGLNEEQVASIINKCPAPPNRDFYVLLLMVSSFAAAERKGASWDFAKIVQNIDPISKEALPPFAQKIYEALFFHNVSFREIEAVLHVAAFLHLFTKAPYCVCLTESSRKPAMQWQFEGGLTALFPLDIAPSIEIIKNKSSLTSFFDFPKTPYETKEQMQLFPYLECVALPNLFEIAITLKEGALALQFFWLAGIVQSNFAPKEALALFLPLLLDGTCRAKEIAEMENYLAAKKIYPRWNLEVVKSEEEAILALGMSGVPDFAHMAYAKWSLKRDLALGYALACAFEPNLASRIRGDLLMMEGLAAEVERALLEQQTDYVLGQNDRKAALRLVFRLAKLKSKRLDDFLGRLVNHRGELVALINSGIPELIRRAVQIWKSRFSFDLALAEQIFNVLDEKGLRIKLGLILLLNGKDVGGYLEPLLSEEHPRSKELLLAVLGSPFPLKNSDLVEKVLFQVAENLPVKEALELFEAAKGKQISALPFFQSLRIHQRDFLTGMVFGKLISPKEALEALTSYLPGHEEEELIEIASVVFEDLAESEREVFTDKMVVLFKGKLQEERLAKAVLALHRPPPEALTAPLRLLCDDACRRGDFKSACELHDLAKTRGLYLHSKEVARFQAEQALKSGGGGVLPLVLDLMEPSLLEKAFEKGLLDGLTQRQMADILIACFKGVPNPSMTAFLIQRLQKSILRKEEGLKKGIAVFSNKRLSQLLREEKIPEAYDLLAALKRLEISPELPRCAALKSLAEQFPDVRELVVPFMDIATSFVYQTVLVKADLLLKEVEGGPLSVHAPDTAVELWENDHKRFAFNILWQFKLSSPLWQPALRFLASTQDPVLLHLLKRKEELEKVCTREVLLEEIDQLFLRCKDSKEAAKAFEMWEPLLRELEPARLAKVLFLVHFAQIDTFAKQCESLQKLYNFPPDCINSLSGLYANATVALLENCKVAKETIPRFICAKLLEHDTIQVDPFLVVSCLAKSQEAEAWKLALKFILKGLDRLPPRITPAMKIEAELVVRRVLTVDGQGLFELFDHPKGSSLFNRLDIYSYLYDEAIIAHFKEMNDTKRINCDLFKRSIERFLERTELFIIEQHLLDRLMNELNKILSALLLYSDATRKTYSSVWSKINEGLFHGFKWVHGAGCRVARDKTTPVQLVEYRMNLAGMAVNSITLERIGGLGIVESFLEQGFHDFYLLDKKGLEEIMTAFCLFCHTTGISEWDKLASVWYQICLQINLIQDWENQRKLKEAFGF